MAAKNADLARGHFSAEIFLTEDLIAESELELEANISYEPASPGFIFLIEDFPAEIIATIGDTPASSPGGGSTITYRMRGFDQNGAVNGYVFWSSSEVDSDASDYAGSAGPVVDIVVVDILG